MNQDKEKRLANLGLVVYILLGFMLRFFMTFPCGSGFEPIHDIVKPWSIGFIIGGIVFGYIAFKYRNKVLSGKLRDLKNVAQGAITGFSIGWGGTTIVIFVFNPCS